MVAHYNEKGKIFTQVVSKKQLAVTIHTNQQVIQGYIHIRLDARTKDELNGEERFIAVSDAVIYNSQNEEVARSSFLLVNSSHIVWLIPEEE